MPYSGEEVKLHWANHDQYYIKTGENFKDYTFNIEDNFNITFILTDAEIERDNNKSDDKKVYVLSEPSEEYEKPVYVLENENKTQAELFIRLSYRYGKDVKQKDSIEEILNSVKQLENDNDISSDIKSKIKNIFSLRDNKVSHIEYHLNKYIAKNSFDFFIHKDLKKFLMQELDFYIKNEVIYLQDLYGSVDNSNNLVMNVKKASVIQNIGSEIITFLAQLEDFQKELYLKKKFVTETNYCITLDKINEKYYDEIIANKAQTEEWKKLFAIDEIEFSTHTPAYSEPLTKDFLKANEYLVLDTAFFSEEFKENIIADIENLDENIDGVLIHGDNFQALNLMQEKYKEQVQCVYIDPPYNTENRDFNYKDNYKHSSWLSMMNDRLGIMKKLLNEKGVFFSSIDDNELSNLRKVGDTIFGEQSFVTSFLWTKTATPPGLSNKCRKTVEFIECYESKLTNNRFFGSLLDGGDAPLLNNGNPIKELNFPKNSVKFIFLNDGIINKGNYEKVQLLDDVVLVDGYNYNSFRMSGEFKWSQPYLDNEVKLGTYFIIKTNKMSIRFQRPINECSFKTPNNSLNIELERSVGIGTNESALKELYDLKLHQDFSYPKPISLIKYLINMNTYIFSSSLILDFFAGSGTTGHAVINLNREDNGKRKYILVEMGEYFDTVTKPRIEKVIYSKDWKDGKPVSREGSSHIFKYIRLESYEDTLNNIEFSKSFNIDDFLQTEYITKYKISKETESSKIYLPVEVFYNPFDFQLKITRKNESRVQKIDLIETFNFLIGLNVNNIYTKKYSAEFKSLETGRLEAQTKLDDNGQYIFKIVEGVTLKGEKVLVIWRNIVGDINNNDYLNKNNAVLESVTLKNQIKPADSEYDIIYINCTNSLQNFAKENSYKVALIEEVMKDKMFNGI